MLRKLNGEKIALAVLVILGLVKLWKLNGGVVLGEPDEVIHLEVLRNFRSGDIWPVFAGKGWYYNFPLFLYLGWPLSYLFGTNFITYRVVSVLFSLALSLGIYFYLRWKSDAKAAFLGALIWSLCPFVVYYSRLGLIEMMVTSLMFLALFSFDYAVLKKSIRWSVISGVLLSLAILTKYTAFIFVIPMVLVWVVKTVKDRKIDFYPFVPLALAGGVTLLAVLIFYQHDGFLFKLQAGASLGIFTDWWKNVNGGYWDIWWQKTAWWVGGLPLLLAGVGLFWYLFGRVREAKEFKKYDFFALAFLVTAVLITTRKPFNPRYFLPVVPFLCVYAAFGLEWVLVSLPSKTRWVSADLTLRVGELAILLFVIVLIVPQAVIAFKALNHTLVEEAGFFARANNQKLTANSYLFSNWWPTFFRDSSGFKNTTWLAESVKETQEFAETNNRSALTILNQEGGVVLLEQLYSKDLYTPNVRKVAQDLLERNASPVAVIKDFQPNFPFYKTDYNEIKVYLIKPGQRFP